MMPSSHVPVESGELDHIFVSITGHQSRRMGNSTTTFG
jgi:hypothetical protein